MSFAFPAGTSAVTSFIAPKIRIAPPPTRGVFKGEAKSELSVAVQVLPSSAPLPEDKLPVEANWLVTDRGEPEEPDYERQRRQQQQQQQQ